MMEVWPTASPPRCSPSPCPMSPIPPRSPGGLSFEPKWDGFRGLVSWDGENVEIGSRGAKPLTRYFPELVEAFARLLPEPCLLDGEVVVPKGEPGAQRLDWESLTQRIHPAASRVNMLAETTPAMFIAFDLLARGDRDLQPEPFECGGPSWSTCSAGCRTRCTSPARPTTPTLARGWLARVRGRRARRRRRQAARAAVRAEQAHDVQDQARPDGRRRRARLPHPQVGPGRRVAAGRAVHRRTGGCTTSAPCRPGATRAGSSSSTSSRRWSSATRRAMRVTRRGREVPVLRGRRDSSFVRLRPGARARGALRPARGLALPPHGAVRALAARPRPGVVHLRAARAVSAYDVGDVLD